MTDTIQPVVVAIDVRRGIEEAFRVFTAEIGAWWPVAAHSVEPDKVETVVLEGRAGGRLYERWHDGGEVDWGRGVAWEPPVDVIETEHEVLILAALPGVDSEQVEAVIHDGHLLISGQRVLPAERAVKLPDKISYEQAAAMMLKGMTVQYLVRRTYKVQKGDNILIHAAAGGIGLIACQWANHLGANVIGTVGSKDKAELAKKNGAHHVILYRDEDFVAKVKEITGGKMCEVVYDGVGKATFPASLDCIKPLGIFVSFGSASGPIDAFNINILQTKGSLFATRPTLNTYVAKREDLLKTANELFDVVASGAVKIPVNQKYPLKDAQQAHRDLEGRKTTGASILVL